MSKKKPKLIKFKRDKFDLSECEATIQIVQNIGTTKHGTAFLNIRLPDGRWIPFKQVEGSRVPLKREEKEA